MNLSVVCDDRKFTERLKPYNAIVFPYKVM